MATIDITLFEQFVASLNGELRMVGATLRVSHVAPSARGMVILENASGRALGPVPDNVDAQTILAIELLLDAARRLDRDA